MKRNLKQAAKPHRKIKTRRKISTISPAQRSRTRSKMQAARKAAAAGSFRIKMFREHTSRMRAEHPSSQTRRAGTAPVRSRATSRQARIRTRTRPTAAGTATGSPLPSRGSRRRTARTAPSPANIINGTMRIISRPRRRKVSMPGRRKIKA